MASQENAALIASLRSGPPLKGTTMVEWRDEFVALYADFPVPPQVKREKFAAGEISGEWFRVDGPPNKAVLYLHGGGYGIGSTASHRALISQIAVAVGADVLGLNYRLAPEHPFPGAIEDSVSCYSKLLQMGYPASGLAVVGDSAGAGLAAALLVALRDRGIALPACAALMSGWYDLTMSLDALERNRPTDPLVMREVLDAMAEAYCRRDERRHPYASPLFADLAKLPPMLIQASAHEVLTDDSIELAKRAEAAGVNVTLELENEVVHVWHQYAHAHPEGREAIARVGSYVRRHLGPATSAGKVAATDNERLWVEEQLIISAEYDRE